MDFRPETVIKDKEYVSQTSLSIWAEVALPGLPDSPFLSLSLCLASWLYNHQRNTFKYKIGKT